ncbi:hypothetical protein DB34_07250 [Acetobacter pasteurianus]|nr:hypothetical protein DB34_07250 [Acetobacter pasteurianus]
MQHCAVHDQDRTGPVGRNGAYARAKIFVFCGVGPVITNMSGLWADGAFHPAQEVPWGRCYANSVHY